ncbi:uncharacterized protein TNCV_1655421 [Trichonephila clavipes]|nr:uncharacterized protein TNCV_1655421 [Trichonephila clavipes]
MRISHKRYDHLEDNIRRVIADDTATNVGKSHRFGLHPSGFTSEKPAVAVICQKSYLKYLASVMESLDDHFCYTAFVNVVFSMFGLFWINLNMMHVPKESYLDYFCPFIGEMFYLASIGIIVLSASGANEAFSKAKEAVLSLPGKVPRHYQNLKIILRRECKSDIRLTLWKTYTIHRSLFISAIGTLVTYGILVTTLERPCHTGTIQLQISMPSLGFQTRFYEIALSVTNHCSVWEAI